MHKNLPEKLVKIHDVKIVPTEFLTRHALGRAWQFAFFHKLLGEADATGVETIARNSLPFWLPIVTFLREQAEWVFGPAAEITWAPSSHTRVPGFESQFLSWIPAFS